MSRTITEKILAAHAGKDVVRPGELINAHLDLVLGRAQFVMRSLFAFAITEAGEVLLDDDPFVVGGFEPLGVARHLRPGIVGHVEVFGASVAAPL